MSERRGAGRELGATSVAKRAYDHIVARLGWIYRPEMMIPLDTIAQELDVSRQPIRDAVQRLSSEGLVSIVAQVGCVVTRPTRDEIIDMSRLLAASDAIFIPTTCERVTAESLERLDGFVRDTEALLSISSPTDFDEVARLRNSFREFYGEAYRIAATSAIAETIRNVRFQTMMLAALRFFDLRRDLPLVTVHADARRVAVEATSSLRALYGAIERRDVDAASAIARARAMSFVDTSDR